MAEETILVSGDVQTDQAIPDNVEPSLIDEPNTTITRSDFDKLLRLSENLDKSNENVELALTTVYALISRQNDTNIAYENTIMNLTDIIVDVNYQLSLTRKSNQELSNQITRMQVELNNYKNTYWVSLFAVVLMTFMFARGYHIFKQRGKGYWLVQWIRSINPFRIPVPGVEDTRQQFRRRRVK